MAKRITWSLNAISDKIEILNYWNKVIGTTTYSKKLNRTFKLLAKMLLDYPFAGKKNDENDVHCFVKGNYQIYYTIENDSINILHIWDCRRNPEDLKFGQKT